jgi:cation diffusion facilitator family transporter
MASPDIDRSRLTRYAWLSIAAALSTITLKGGAYAITGSVGLLSDAVESMVNLLAALMALAMLAWAALPPDEEHAYGHGKAEYLASGFEGALILIASAGIVVTAGARLLRPQPIEQVELGLAITAVASTINWFVARVLQRAGRRYHSITLEADAKHLMTDVWTSVAVIAGVGLAAATGHYWLDPVLALAVALNILRMGFDLLRRSAYGLLDTALPEAERAVITGILDGYRGQGVHHHALRTRQAGAHRFISVHILVPGEWSVQRGHELLEQIEERICEAVPRSTVFTHLEPVEDPVSWDDLRLERRARPRQE